MKRPKKERAESGHYAESALKTEIQTSWNDIRLSSNVNLRLKAEADGRVDISDVWNLERRMHCFDKLVIVTVAFCVRSGKEIESINHLARMCSLSVKRTQKAL